METAILLVSFVAGSSALGATYLGSSLEVTQEVQSVAMDTINSIVEEGQVYIEHQRLQLPYGTSPAGQEAFDLVGLENILATALDDESRHTIELQRNGRAVVTIDLSTMGIAGLTDVVAALEEALGAQVTYTIDVSGEEMLVSMEIQPPLMVGGPDNTG